MARRNKIEPGEFGKGEPLNSEELEKLRRSITGEHYLTANPTYAPDLIELCAFFTREFGVPASVYYPSCDMDATPVRAFPNSKVTLLDINGKAVSALKRNGIEAIEGDARTYRPTELYDLLILLNPGIKSTDATPALKVGGYVISNDWHGNTTQLLALPKDFDFKGIAQRHKETGLTSLMAIEESKALMAKTDPFFNLYAFFQKIH